MSNFLVMTNEKNWVIIKKDNIMGLGGRWGKNFFPKLKVGDKCIIYITKISAFGGIYGISSKNTNKKVKWETGSYDLLFEITPLIIPNKPIPIREHIAKLKFITNKEFWYAHLHFPKKIPKEDIEYISNIMK